MAQRQCFLSEAVDIGGDKINRLTLALCVLETNGEVSHMRRSSALLPIAHGKPAPQFRFMPNAAASTASRALRP
jgi:hypothetical protein